MSSWNKVLQEVIALNRPDAFDIVRRQKMQRVRQLTGRHLVIYATDFTTSNPIKLQMMGGLMSIGIADKDGFDEITRSLTGQTSEIDVLLHSPGGSAEATESIVAILRSRFSNVRFIIPNIAKSAATMLAMSGEQILMDERSELGPIDPQFIFSRDNRLVAAPAQAIKDQFDTAQEQINGDPAKLPAWVPLLREYGPSLLAECDNQLALAEDLVSKWLQTYMFAQDAHAEAKTKQVGKYLNNHNHFRSHGRRVGMDELQRLGLNILDMRTEPQLHEAVRELYTALTLTFDNTGAGKIFENTAGDALMSVIDLVQQPPPQPPQPQPPQPHPPPAPRPNTFPSGRNPSKGKRRGKK